MTSATQEKKGTSCPPSTKLHASEGIAQKISKAIASADRATVEVKLPEMLKGCVQAMSLREVEEKLCSGNSQGRRLVREVTWKLIEEGKIKFNSSWSLIPV